MKRRIVKASKITEMPAHDPNGTFKVYTVSRELEQHENFNKRYATLAEAEFVATYYANAHAGVPFLVMQNVVTIMAEIKAPRQFKPANIVFNKYSFERDKYTYTIKRTNAK